MSDALPGLEPTKSKARRTFGPVYAGVCAQIRALTSGPEPAIDAATWAGTIALARSLAASIDAGDARAEKPANGAPQSMMAAQLAALLDKMNPAADAADPMTQLLEEFRAEEERQRDRATPPHPQV